MWDLYSTRGTFDSINTCTCVALEIREFARSGILYYLVRPVLFPEFTTQLTMQLTVAPRSRSLPDLKTRGGPRTTQMRVLRSGSYSQLTAVRPVGARAVGCRRVQREAAMPRPKGGGGAAAAAAEEDAPSTQQVRASVARTEALADRLDELRGRIAGEAEYDSERDLSLDESFELSDDDDSADEAAQPTGKRQKTTAQPTGKELTRPIRLYRNPAIIQ